MTELRTYYKYGECKQGTHNKYYEIEAIELEDGTATWAFRWARIGGICGKPKEGKSSTFEQAESICYTQWTKKSKKYTEVNAMQALASAAQELHERPINGLPRIELDVPSFHAGKSEDRLTKFCVKYQDKLNVIRASKNDMGETEYGKQIETMLKQYCAEFQRIKETAGHGQNCDGHADTAFRTFLNALIENAGIGVYFYHDSVGYCG